MSQAQARKGLILGWVLITLNLCSLIIADDLETFRPNAAGTYTQLSQYPNSGNHYDKVNEVTSDGDTTYVYSIADATDTWNIPDFIGRGTINSVTVYIVVRKKFTGIEFTVFGWTYIITNGTGYQGGANTLTTSYVTYSTIYTTNPQTSAVWTWSEINNLEIGVSLKGEQTGYGTTEARCTQVYAIVDYDYGEVIIF